jgi:hypothetical protein
VLEPVEVGYARMSFPLLLFVRIRLCRARWGGISLLFFFFAVAGTFGDWLFFEDFIVGFFFLSGTWYICSCTWIDLGSVMTFGLSALAYVYLCYLRWASCRRTPSGVLLVLLQALTAAMPPFAYW